MTTTQDIKRRSFESPHASEQKRKAMKERRALLDEGISQEAHVSLANRGRWPAGSKWFWALSAVYGPPGSVGETGK